MVQNEFWTATTMRLFHGLVELENSSTLQQNNITEWGTLHVTTEAQYQGTLPFPTEDTDMFSNYDDDTGNTEFNINDLLNMPSPAPVDVKLLLPHNFQAHLVLDHEGTHHFITAGQLKEKIDNDPPTWLPKMQAYAILSNAEIFVVENVDDFENRKNGGVALVRSSSYGNFLHQGQGYKFSVEAPLAITVEKPAGKFKISGEISLDRYEIVGDVWTRRRIHIAGDDTYCVIQWLHTRPKRKDNVKEDVSNVVKTVGELQLKLDTVATDVTDVKKDVAYIKQGLTNIHTTLATISNHHWTETHPFDASRTLHTC